MKKGFTLVELLAVIVIIGIIGLIAVPNVVNLTNNSKKEIVKDTTKLLAKTAEDYYSYNLMNSSEIDKVSLTDDTLDYSGNRPDSGYALFDDEGRAYIKMYYDGYCVVRNYDGTIELDKTSPDNCSIENMVSVTLYLNAGVATYGSEWTKSEKYISTVIGENSTLSNIPTITKTGYKFLGWYTDSDELVDLNKVIDKSIVATAKFEANTYTVTIDLAGGTTSDSTETVKKIKYGEVYGTLPTPTRTGYTFNGYVTSAGTTIKEKTVLTIASDHTIYASWSARTYTITFVYGDGRSNTTKTVTYGSTYGELPTPEREGYTFLEWRTNNGNNSGLVTRDTEVTITSNQTLYARWDTNKYMVTFVYNNGSANTTKEVTYGSTYGELPTPEKDGYIFNGWATSSGTIINSADKVTITSNQTLYAQWSTGSYLVTFNANGGTVSTPTKNVVYGSTYGELPTPERVGYSFTGWRTGNGNNSALIKSDTTVSIAANHTLYASWDPNSYTVTFVYNNASSNTITNVKYDNTYGTLPSPTKTGYTFKGWYTTGGVKISSTTKVSLASNHTLTAQWTANTYTVNIAVSCGNSATLNSIEVTYDGTYGSFGTFTCSGYTFAGWETADGTEIKSTDIVTITSDIDVTAKWTANTYTITFVYNNGSANTTKNVTYNSTYGTLPTPTKSGYIFNGWATSSGTTISSTTKVAITSNQTLYAQWSAGTYLVTFNTNGGVITTQNKTVTYGSAYGELPTPTRTGYTFNGWYTTLNGNVKVISTTTVSTNANHTLYAKWTANTYTVTFVSSGSSDKLYSNGEVVYFNPNENAVCTSTDYANNSEKALYKGCLKWYAYLDSKEATTVKLILNDNVIIYNSLTSNADNLETLYKEVQEKNWNNNVINTLNIISANEIAKIVGKSSFASGDTISSISSTYNWLFENIRLDGTTSSYDYWGYITSTLYSGNSGEMLYYVFMNNLGNVDSGGMDFQITPIGIRPSIVVSKSVLASNTVGAKIVTYGSTYGTLPTPIKDGYRFLGWYTTGGVKIEETAKVTITSNQTLYAQWASGTGSYTVTFVYNDGVTTNTTKVVTNGTLYGSLPTPSKSGYTFSGWYTSSSGGTKITKYSIVDLSSNITLYALYGSVSTGITGLIPEAPTVFTGSENIPDGYILVLNEEPLTVIYSNSDIANLVKSFNDENSTMTIHEIIEELGISEDEVMATDGVIVDISEYDVLTPFFDVFIDSSSSSVLDVRYGLDSDMVFSFKCEAAKLFDIDSLLLMVIDQETGEVYFCELTDYDPMTGEITVEVPTLGPIILLSK